MSAELTDFNSLKNALCLPSLEDISMLAAAKAFMIQDDVRKIICQHYARCSWSSGLTYLKARKIMSICKSQFQIPEILEAKFLCVVTWVRTQYCDWIYYVVTYMGLNSKFPNKKDFIGCVMNSVIWDINGGVNCQLSLQQLFLSIDVNDDDDEDLATMFDIASRCCLEDNIRLLWSKLSATAKNDMLEEQKESFFTFYWACMISGKTEKYSNYVSECLKSWNRYRHSRELLKYDDIFNEYSCSINNLAFFLSVFKSDSVNVKYFYGKASGIDVEHILNLYLSHFMDGGDKKYQDADILFFLLSKIDDDIAERFFNNFFPTFLKLSVKYWPLQKCLLNLMKMSSGCIDQILLYDLIRKLLDDVRRGKTDMFLVKNFWKNIPFEVKQSFCLYISVKQKDRRCGELWGNVSKEIIDMFLREEELKRVLTPYENIGIYHLIMSQEYGVIDHWLKKCLISEEAIISFTENFIITKSAEMIATLKAYSLDRVIEFMDWAFKHEDVMDKDKILKAKDQAIKKVGVRMLINGIKLKKWKDLQKFVDWILKNRVDYESKLINLKTEALEMLFKKTGTKYWSESNFAKNFKEFLSYGINDIDDLKKAMKKVHLKIGENCAIWLKKGAWSSVDAFLKFLAEHGRDILKTKQKVFHYICSNHKEIDFKEEGYCENIKKLLSWNCETDGNVKKNVEEIKKLIINKHALDSIIKCIQKNSCEALNNILDCFFKDENDDQNYSKMVFDLKIRAIEKLISDDYFRTGKNIVTLVKLINWGKNDDNFSKEIWDAKKYFIENFKKNVEANIIPDLILKKNVISTLFEENEDERDFQITLWDMKEFLLEKMINDDDCMLIGKLFEKFDKFNEFLNWNGFSGAWMKSLKKLILDDKGVCCCLSWILNDKFAAIHNFLDWCILNDPCMKSKILKLKQDVLKNFVRQDSKNWEENDFVLLDKFLALHYSNAQKNLKRDLINKFAIKACAEKLSKGDLKSVTNFLNWAYEENTKQLREDFKENVLREILSGDCLLYWTKNYGDDRLNFHDGLNKFLYEYNNPDISKIFNMKLNLLELHFNEIFTKLLTERKRNRLKHFVEWIFDEKMKSDKCRPRVCKFKKEIFDQFGKQYCVFMLTSIDSEAAAEFCSLCLSSKTDMKNTRLLFWDFKKEVIKEIFTNDIHTDYTYHMYTKSLWPCLNRFLSCIPCSSKIKNEIREFKNIMWQQYGIDIVKQFFKVLMADEDSEPKYFLRWLFDHCQTNLDENTLLNFKKEVLENVLSIEYEILLKTNIFYYKLQEILDFKSTSSMIVRNLKKSVVEVQGVKLCISLICRNNVSALNRFLDWAIPLFDGDSFDFQRAVSEELVKNVELVYSWESLKSFLDHGLDLNNEQDNAKYTILKNYVFQSCGVDICYNWILKNQWDDVPVFLEWGLAPLESNKLVEFKTRLNEKFGPAYCNARIFDDDWEKLEKFLNWSFESYEKNNKREEKMIDLKVKTLKGKICYKDHLQILLRYLEWGFKTKASLNKFKKSILKKEHPLNYFVSLQKYKSKKTFQLWFVNKK